MAAKRREGDPRALALAVLLAVEDGGFADAELGRRLRASALPARDRAMAARLVYGTLAWQGYLDYCLSACGRRPQALDPPVRALLRLGLYQLTQLTRVPPFAAVNTTVELARGHRRGAATGLVNAVLRRFLRERGQMALPDRSTDLVGFLAVRWSHPSWLIERWLEELGTDETEVLLAANNTPAPTVVRVNPRRATPRQVIDGLGRDGVAAHVGRMAPGAVVVEAGGDPALLPGYRAGWFTPQGEASQIASLLLGARPGEDVLDLCAAPGGKATAIAEGLGESGRLLAIDRRPRGLVELKRNARRLGLSSVRSVCADGTRVPLPDDARFDRVLLDAPCSGLGTLRQHPEIRWRRSPAGITAIATRQEALLYAAAARVRQGGCLVYATCTISRVENDDVLRRFLAARPEFALADAAGVLPAGARDLVDADGILRAFPHRHGLDGFFAARLRRHTDSRMVRP